VLAARNIIGIKKIRQWVSNSLRISIQHISWDEIYIEWSCLWNIGHCKVVHYKCIKGKIHKSQIIIVRKERMESNNSFYEHILLERCLIWYTYLKDWNAYFSRSQTIYSVNRNHEHARTPTIQWVTVFYNYRNIVSRVSRVFKYSNRLCRNR